MSKLLEKIRSRGYWKVVIHPANFIEKRVANISDLYPILQKTSVQLRGWDFPHLDIHKPVHIDIDWIEQESEWQHYLEVWRFYQSGQFVDFIGMEEDWPYLLNREPTTKVWKPGLSLNVENAIFQFTEIFEFAARLALTEAGDEQMHLEIGLYGLNGRSLRFDARRGGSSYLKASVTELPYEVDLFRVELIAQARGLALRPAIELFRRFGWDPGLDILRDMQNELLRLGSPAPRRG